MLLKNEWASPPSTPLPIAEATTGPDSTIDSHFFASALATNDSVKTPPPTIGTHFLAEQSNYLRARANDVSKGLSDLVKDKNSIKSVEVPQALAESKEVLTVSVKIIKHCVSMVEKTTNLQ
ncbi:hypothetical protein ACQRBV_05485 [Pseudomonas sp. R11F]|uniref:hypothetical protein n=1 Tax=Pseudomonas TaxID=286 RepID=UPI000F89AB27|nr:MULTISPECIES: hypothetical protein [Pseudomonas]MBM9488736.1 hypothetical protein [Pseudomonas sp. ICBG1301]UOP08408.1 hypothetical protein LDL65_14935 [Pseudomonas palleroniana]